jgi:hypothetical protein
MSPETLLSESVVWIEGYEGRYTISNTGEVISYCRGKIKKRKPHFLKDGYLGVSLYGHDKKPKIRSIHRLVAKAFCPGFKEGLTVNHKDCNKLNNHFQNLEWMPNAENTRLYYESGHKVKLRLSRMKPVEGTNTITGEKIQFPSATEARKHGFTSIGINESIRTGIRHRKHLWRFI